jgi:putative ABC transport system permease protein
MLKHFFDTALRHFRRHKFTTTLNIACLAFGLMCFLGVFSLVAYLQGSDRHIAHADRVVVVTTESGIPGSQTIKASMPSSGYSVASLLQADFPKIETITRITNIMPMASGASLKSGTNGTDAKVRFADASVFDVLQLPLLVGDSQALAAPRSIVISKAVAIKLFGDASSALGRDAILFGSTPLTVTGVLDSIPQPSHLSTDTLANPFQKFDVLVSMDVFEARQRNPESLQSWGFGDVATYIVLPKDGSLTADELRRNLPDFVDRHAPKSDRDYRLGLEPLWSIALSSFETGMRVSGAGFSVITLLYVLGGIVLLIACLNYANLALAQSATWAKEIGMRRIVGATRLQVMAQCLFEALFASTVAAFFAIVLLTVVLLAIPALSEQLSAARFFFQHVLPSPRLWMTLVITIVIVTAVSASYPAFVLSKVRPIQAVRAGMEKSPRRRIAAFIVGAQFVSASFLLIAILVMQSQSAYIRKAALATLDDPFVVLANYSDTPANYDTLRTELLRQPHIKGVTAAASAPWEIHNMGGAAETSLTTDPIGTRRVASRHFDNLDFFATLEFKLLAGRQLAADRADDNGAAAFRLSDATINAIVDRAFIDEYGWSPEETIGKTVYIWRTRNGQTTSRAVTIVGVVDSKPLSVIQFGRNANVFFLDPQASRAIIVRISKDDIQAGVREIDDVWNKIAPNVAIQRQFADEALDKSMWMIDTISRVFGSVAIIAVVIAMLGLVGISIHTLYRRTHEIGVRKTLGADTRSVLLMLYRDFSRPILIANLIAWPLAFVSMRGYLSVFTHSAGLGFVPFLASLLVTLLVAWAAVSAQVVRAAKLKPADVLRYE